MLYLFLSSRDSSGDYPTNKWYDFTIVLPKTIELNENWECAQMDIKCFPHIEKEFVVYTDIVHQSYIRDSTASILRRVYSSPSIFVRPYFIPINRTSIERIRMYIRDLETGGEPTEAITELTCTLAFRFNNKNKTKQ